MGYVTGLLCYVEPIYCIMDPPCVETAEVMDEELELSSMHRCHCKHWRTKQEHLGVQAIAEDPPLEPHELLKRLAHQALIKYDKSGNPIEAAIDPADLPSPDQLPALSSLPKNPMTRPKADARSMATN